MENQIQIFEHEKFGKVRVIMINGEPWFVGKDVALNLAYSNPQKAIRDHVDDEDKKVNESFTLGQGSSPLLINESGMYALIFGSKLPKAKEFKHWVTYEVLPSIRKTGSYSSPSAPVKKTRRQISALACVYVLLLSNGLIKIGHTSNISRRIAEIERQTHSTVKDVYHTILFSREIACRLEYVCQKKFSSFRTEGEFFNVDFDEVRKVIESFVKAEVERNIALLQISDMVNEHTEEKTLAKALLMEAAKFYVGNIFEQPVD